MDWMNLVNDLEKDNVKRDTIVKAPFGWPGGKTKSLKHIIPILPYTPRFVEVFGGSGAVLLARQPVTLEVFNDRYSGITDFYKCIKNRILLTELLDWIDCTIHSRELFVHFKSSWQHSNPVERAGRWLYMITYSFGQKGIAFGRAISPKAIISGKLRNKIPLLDQIHNRLKAVQIENQDWYDCIIDYDHHDTVFYLDPPYIDAYEGTYDFEMSKDDHRRLLDVIFSTSGYFAVSGYSNPLYENQNWDNRFEWDAYISIQDLGASGNKKDHVPSKRAYTKEVLWIKEAR